MSKTKVINPSKSEEDNLHHINVDFHNIRAIYILNGKNYLELSQFVRTYLKGKGKLTHLLGTRLKAGDPKFDACDEEDSMIMSWL